MDSRRKKNVEDDKTVSRRVTNGLPTLKNSFKYQPNQEAVSKLDEGVREIHELLKYLCRQESALKFYNVNFTTCGVQIRVRLFYYLASLFI